MKPYFVTVGTIDTVHDHVGHQRLITSGPIEYRIGEPIIEEIIESSHNLILH